MSGLDDSEKELYAGLQALSDSAYPRRCNSCGRVYDTEADFIRQTSTVSPETSGLKQAEDNDQTLVVELYRNCECGSMLLHYFSDRRDISHRGEQLRKYFGRVMVKLAQAGYSRAAARLELCKGMHAKDDEILRNYDVVPPKKKSR